MNNEQVGPQHYRVVEVLDPEGLLIQVVEYKPIKETPRGYWVVSRYAPTWLSVEELRKRKFAKWVSKTSTKRLCYPDINDAIRSFKRRKEFNMQVASDAFEVAATNASNRTVLF